MVADRRGDERSVLQSSKYGKLAAHERQHRYIEQQLDDVLACIGGVTRPSRAEVEAVLFRACGTEFAAEIARDSLTGGTLSFERLRRRRAAFALRVVWASFRSGRNRDRRSG